MATGWPTCSVYTQKNVFVYLTFNLILGRFYFVGLFFPSYTAHFSFFLSRVYSRFKIVSAIRSTFFRVLWQSAEVLYKILHVFPNLAKINEYLTSIEVHDKV